MIKMQSLDALDKGRAQESASCVQNVSRGFDALKRTSDELIQKRSILKEGMGQSRRVCLCQRVPLFENALLCSKRAGLLEILRTSSIRILIFTVELASGAFQINCLMNWVIRNTYLENRPCKVQITVLVKFRRS